MEAVKSGLGSGVGHIAWESPHEALLAVAEHLRAESVPMGDLLSEMIVASTQADVASELGPAVGELLSEPMTGAESVGTLLLATIGARARDAEVDDEAILRVMALAAVLVARFETYLAERSATRAP